MINGRRKQGQGKKITIKTKSLNIVKITKFSSAVKFFERKGSIKKEEAMQGKLSYDQKYGIKYYSKNSETYYLVTSVLVQGGKRKIYGTHYVGGSLVKFAQLDKEKFFSYEVRFAQTAIKELHIETPQDLKDKSIEVALKMLERGCCDDMIVMVKQPDEYVAQSSEQPLPKHWFSYRYKRPNVL